MKILYCENLHSTAIQKINMSLTITIIYRILGRHKKTVTKNLRPTTTTTMTTILNEDGCCVHKNTRTNSSLFPPTQWVECDWNRITCAFVGKSGSHNLTSKTEKKSKPTTVVGLGKTNRKHLFQSFFLTTLQLSSFRMAGERSLSDFPLPEHRFLNKKVASRINRKYYAKRRRLRCHLSPQFLSPT